MPSSLCLRLDVQPVCPYPHWQTAPREAIALIYIRALARAQIVEEAVKNPVHPFEKDLPLAGRPTAPPG